MDAGHDDRFMIDPSIFLTVEGLDALDDEEVDAALRTAVISSSFYEALVEGRYEALEPFMEVPDPQLIARARDVLPGRLAEVEKFSFRDVEALPSDVRAVTGALLEGEGPAGEILADEAVYLATQSWLVSKLSTLRDGLRQARANVIEYVTEHGANVFDFMVKFVVPEKNIPARLTGRFCAKVGVKWIVYVGAAIPLTVFVPPAGASVTVGLPLLYHFVDP